MSEEEENDYQIVNSSDDSYYERVYEGHIPIIGIVK
jgi:hypothetical protein